MGAWGAEFFKNDDAADWVWELEDDDGSFLIATLREVVDTDFDDYIERPEANNAIAAAEIVATARGRHGGELPSEAREWITRNAPLVDDALLALAAGAVERVFIASELKDLWDETDDTEWSELVQDLLERLRAR